MDSVSIKDVSLSFGSIEVLKTLNLDVQDGEFIVLLGPSGCGKSTLLNCIAGLLDVTEGQIHIKGKNVTWEEPKDRGIGMVFQSYALYPQMTVEGNLSFGLKNQGMPKSEIAERVAKTAEILQIEALLGRKPGQLSGGQRQRVAIGRALVRDVDVFLFDEPLSNLDAKLRSELRVEIKRLHHQLKNTMIYVTHDQIEALTLADRIAVMKGGVIQQLDTPLTIYNKPKNLFVAGFIGSPSMNFLQGRIHLEEQAYWFVSDDLKVPLSDYQPDSSMTPDTAVVLGVRPEQMTIITSEVATDRSFTFDAVVDVEEPMGADSLVWVKINNQSLAIRTEAGTILKPGDPVQITFNLALASVFDSRTETRI